MKGNECKDSQTVYEKVRRRSEYSEKNRHSTDCKFVIIPFIVFAVWSGVVSYGFLNGVAWENFHEKVYNFSFYIRIFFNTGYSFIAVVIISNIIATVLFLMILINVPKFCVYIQLVIIAIESLLLVVGIEYVVFKIVDLDSFFHILGYLFIVIGGIIIKIIYNAIVLASVIKSGVPAITEIVQRTFLSFSSFLHLLPIVLVVLLIDISIGFFSAASLCSNIHISLKVVVSYGGLYLCSFILCYGRMIISPTIASWNYDRVMSDIRKASIFEHMIEITRYHLGSVALAAIPIFPFVSALVIASKHKITPTQDTLDKISYFFLVLRLMWNNAEYSISATSMYGTTFFQSVKTTINLFTKDCPLSLAFIQMIFSILTTLLSVITILIVATTYIWITIVGDAEYDTTCIIISAITTVVICLSPIIIFFDLHALVNLFCSLEVIEMRDPSKKLGLMDIEVVC